MRFLKRINLILALEFIIGFSASVVNADSYKDYLSQQSSQTYFKYDDVKCSDPASPDCYRQTLCKFRGNYGSEPLNSINLRPKHSLESCMNEEGYDNFFYGITVKAYSNVQLRSSSKTPLVVITIHGLWGNAGQFKNTTQLIRSANFKGGINYIELTLPGHLKTYAGSEDDLDYKAKYQDYLNMVNKDKPFAENSEWIVALENTLKIARLIGDKTILIGQSTGGLLAALSAIEYPDLVDELVLVEPALRVNKLMNGGACLSRHLPDALINLGSKILGVHIPEGTSVKMGCEVQKLADNYFPRKYTTEMELIEGRPVQVEDFSELEEVAKKIKKPVLMINNENDKIVSAEANRRFYKGLAGVKEYTSINLDRKLPHGMITGFPYPGFVAQRLFEFYYHNFPNTKMAKEFLDTAKRDVQGLVGGSISNIGPRCLQYASALYCQKNISFNSTHNKFIVGRVCRILNNSEKCEEFKNSVAIVENYWKNYLQSAIINGKQAADKARLSTPPPQEYENAEKFFSIIRDELDQMHKAYQTQ